MVVSLVPGESIQTHGQAGRQAERWAVEVTDGLAGKQMCMRVNKRTAHIRGQAGKWTGKDGRPGRRAGWHLDRKEGLSILSLSP